MKKLNPTLPVFLLLLTAMLTAACEKKTVEKQIFLSLSFEHRIDNANLVLDTQYYMNAANNKYRIHEVKYFISALQLYKKGVQINI
ncbi:MAG: hypothetical protein LBI60_01180, partial [Bacteroidales bacterium]|nr:hypothetical protein [Bacteroidales bacterium]